MGRRRGDFKGFWLWAVSLGAAFLVFGAFALSAGVAEGQSEGDFSPLFEREVGPFAVGMGWTPAAPQVGFVNVGVAPRTLGAGGRGFGRAGYGEGYSAT